MSIRRTVLALAVTALGVLPLAACGSDHAGVSTAPTSITATHGAPASAPAGVFHTQDHPGTPGERLSGDARVTSLVSGTACPTLSFMVGTFTIVVDAATVFERGACADIVVGARLRVTGTRQADNSILATSIEVKNNGQGEGEPVEGEGIITGLETGTSCPTLTFLIGTKSISVTADTIYEHGSCDDLTIGRRVHVKGTMTGDDVVATLVHVQSDSPGHPVIEGDGRVTSLVSGTSCPTLQFMAEEEWTVTVDAHTVFIGGACADVLVGRKVGVKGTVTAEHEVLATQIVFKGPGDN